MSGSSSHAFTESGAAPGSLPGSLPFVDTVADTLDSLYDANDPTTGIGGDVDPEASRMAFGHVADDHERVDIASRLLVSTSHVDFSQTRVGQRVSRSVVITNTDPTRTIEVDGVHLDDLGLGDFEVHGASKPLAPHQSVTFHISYAPTSEGEHAARVRMFESAGLTTPFIELRGSAIESDGGRRERVSQLEAQLARTEELPQTFKLERSNATKKILIWKNRVTSLVQATATWTTQNWTKFLSETGGDFRVSWTEGHVGNVVGDYLSAVAGIVSSHPVIEFVASTLTSLIYDALFTATGNRESEELVYQKVKKTGNEIEKRQIDVAHLTSLAIERIEAQATTAEHKAVTATDRAAVMHVDEWATREAKAVPAKVNTSDRSLYTRLIQSWVLERSANATEPTEATNRLAFAAARKSAFGLEAGEDIARPDLFVFQARHEWTSLGIQNVPEIEARLSSQVHALVRQAQAAGLEGPEVASFVSNMIAQPVHVDLKPSSIENTRHAMEAAGIPLASRDFLANRLECLVSLGIDGSSVRVRFFNYYLGRYVGTRAP